MLRAVPPLSERQQRMFAVQQMYQEILGRMPDPGAINWVNSNLTLDQIRQELINSAENRAQDAAEHSSSSAASSVTSSLSSPYMMLVMAAVAAYFLLRKR